MAEGRFRPIDPALAYFIIVGACQQFLTNTITVKTVPGQEPDGATVERYARFVLEVFLSGIAER